MYVNLTTSLSSRKQLIILGAWAVELYSSVLVIDMKRHPYMRRSSATSPYSSNTPSSYPRTNFCRTCSDDLARTPRLSTPTGQFACFQAVNSVCRTWQLLSSSCTRPSCLTSYHSQPSTAFTSSPINSTCRAYSTSSLTTSKKNMLLLARYSTPRRSSVFIAFALLAMETCGNTVVPRSLAPGNREWSSPLGRKSSSKHAITKMRC